MKLDKVFSYKKVEDTGEIKILLLWYTDSDCLLDISKDLIIKSDIDFEGYFDDDDDLIKFFARRLAEATFEKLVVELMEDLDIENYTIKPCIVENHCFFVLTIECSGFEVERVLNYEIEN